MKILLGKFKLLTFILLLSLCGNVNAQCSITGVSPNASTFNPNPCTLLTNCGGVLYIGDGVNPTNLIMSTALNLTCLGSIQLIVRNNASIDFSAGNDHLTLAAGSSILFEGTGTLIGGSCNASERIYIGSDLIASCNGQGPGADYSFPGLVIAGGFNIVNVSPISASVCGSGSFTFTATAIPSSSATIKWYTVSSGGTPFLTGTTGSSSTYSTTLSATTTYYVEATIGTFTTPRKAVVATVNPIPSVPTVATSQPTCNVATATITITAIAGETYSFDNGTYSSTLVYSGLAQGSTHTVYAKSTAGCISNVTTVTIKNVTNTWNGSSWSNVSQPVITENIVFNGNYSSPSSLDACSCTVNAGVFVNINAGHTLNLTNGLNVAGLGTIVFLDGASLLQSNTASNINSGDIDYQRSTSARPTDYTYWSSPVSPMALGELYPAGSTFYSYEATSTGEDWKQEGSATGMAAGIGYIANRGAAIPSPGLPPPPDLLNFTFIGVPNNGHYEINEIFANKSYLLGNPYPSAIDADTFLIANKDVLGGTLYFWTHNTQIGIGVSDPGTGLYAYSGDDYATYNGTGGVGAIDSGVITGSAPSGISGGNNNTPLGKIAAGQGFFASSLVTPLTSSIVFNNNMRVAGNNTQFFKMRNAKSEKVIEKNRVWLNLTNTQGAFKQTLIGYLTDATNEYDSRFDGESFDGNEFVDFYSVNQDKNLVIQGRALPFDENDEVPLGFRTTINGSFTINIDQVDGLLANQAVFIEDKLTNTITDLKSGNYTFNTTPGTFDDRFVLRYTNKTLATATFDSLENTVLVSSKNKQIKINSFVETIDKVTIYDLLGRQIYQKNKVNSNEFSIANLVSSRQALLVKTVLQNGQEVSKKIIY